ncbi:MAG: hypothetical protein ACYDCQ_13235, partial [Dehalococcoidia bacterium]
GRTQAPPDLLSEIEAIVGKLYILPDDVQVWPGHGEGTMIGNSKLEYAIFKAKEHPADLCGDVTWTGS